MPPHPSGLLAVAVLVAAGCAAPAAPPPVAPTVPIAPASPPAPPSAPPQDAPLDPAEALTRGVALADAWHVEAWYAQDKRASFLAERSLDEATVRRMVEALARPCLAQRAPEAAACRDLVDADKPSGRALAALVTMLGELADPAPHVSASLRLLLRLDARRISGASTAVARTLERRMLGSTALCAPPTPADVEAARRSLGDLALVAPAARWPTAAELDDLAYLYAVVADAGPEVGAAPEDVAAPRLPDGHPDLATRDRLREEMQAALLDGDAARHLLAAEAYLATLGYPGRLRLAEERDQRWGGSGASYAMRDAARSAEILGRYDVAEALYRRAGPGGGACGTSTSSRLGGQVEGVIRAAEQGRGCRAAAAEQLYTVSAHGPERLARAGFDVPRLYAAALLTVGRDDAAVLGRALGGLPTRAGDAVARLTRLGTEAWATRLRAIPGYADTARTAAVPRLLDLAEVGLPGDRAQALTAVGMLLEDHGFDPCARSRLHRGWHRGSSSGDRAVRNVMGTCESRPDAATFEATVRRVEALAGDLAPAVREAVATTLGRLGASRSRGVLRRLGGDTFDIGGTVCTRRDDKPEVCKPNRPVALAAEEGLLQVKSAEKMRADQRAGHLK